jgi:hypothetical protein
MAGAGQRESGGVIYPRGFETARTPQVVTVEIHVNAKGEIEREFHGDPVISAKRKDTVQWKCIVDPNLDDADTVDFQVSHFHKICNFPREFCSHHDNPFPDMKTKRVNCRETITSGELREGAGGTQYKSTWTVYWHNNKSEWDPHIIVHGDGD